MRIANSASIFIAHRHNLGSWAPKQRYHHYLEDWKHENSKYRPMEANAERGKGAPLLNKFSIQIF